MINDMVNPLLQSYIKELKEHNFQRRMVIEKLKEYRDQGHTHHQETAVPENQEFSANIQGK